MSDHAFFLQVSPRKAQVFNTVACPLCGDHMLAGEAKLEGLGAAREMATEWPSESDVPSKGCILPVEGETVCKNCHSLKYNDPAYMATYLFRDACEELKRIGEKAEVALANWKAEVERRPLSALEDSYRAAQAAALIEVAAQVLMQFERIAAERGALSAFTDVTAHVQQEVMRGANYPASSTNPSYNMVGTAKLSAWAKIHDDVLRFPMMRIDRRNH